jgi:cbb3-type cytochrome oxidase cytochrome c subunit
MKKNIWSLMFIVTFGFIFIASSGFYRLQDKDTKGKDIFISNKCNSCHSIESQKIDKTGKMKAPDLSSVGNDHDAKWFAGFLEKKETLNDKKHPIAFKGDEKDLASLTTWLASLKQTGTSIRSSDKKESGK